MCFPSEIKLDEEITITKISSNPYIYKRHDLIKYEVSGAAGYQEVKLDDHKLVNGYRLFIRGRQYQGDGTDITIDTTPHGNFDDPVKAPDISGDVNFELEFETNGNNLSALFFGVSDKVLMLDGLKSTFYF